MNAAGPSGERKRPPPERRFLESRRLGNLPAGRREVPPFMRETHGMRRGRIALRPIPRMR